MEKVVSDALWLSKLNLWKPRSFCLCWLHDSLWEGNQPPSKKSKYPETTLLIGRPNEPCGETTWREIPKHFQLGQPCQPQQKIHEWRSLQRTPDGAAIRQQPHEKTPGRTTQWNPASPQNCQRYSKIIIWSPQVLWKFFFLHRNKHWNTHSFKDTCDGIQNIINKWILTKLVTSKVIYSFIGAST